MSGGIEVLLSGSQHGQRAAKMAPGQDTETSVLRVHVVEEAGQNGAPVSFGFAWYLV